CRIKSENFCTKIRMDLFPFNNINAVEDNLFCGADYLEKLGVLGHSLKLLLCQSPFRRVSHPAMTIFTIPYTEQAVALSNNNQATTAVGLPLSVQNARSSGYSSAASSIIADESIHDFQWLSDISSDCTRTDATSSLLSIMQETANSTEKSPTELPTPEPLGI